VSRYPRSPPELSHPPSGGRRSLRAEILRTTDERSQGRRLGCFRASPVHLTSARRASCVVGELRRSSIPHSRFGTFPLAPRGPPPRRAAPHHATPRHTAPFRGALLPATPRWHVGNRQRLVASLLSSYNSERNRVVPEKGEDMYGNPIMLHRIGRPTRYGAS